MKVLASDLDGTLFTEGEIIKDNLNALKELKNAGNKFVISTGRTVEGVNKILDKYQLDYDYLSLCNGGLIIDKENNTIFDKWIDAEILNNIINDYQGLKDTLIYYDNLKETVLLQNDNADKDKLKKFMSYFTKVIKLDKSKKLADKSKIISVFGIDDNIDRIEKIKNEIVSNYGEFVEVYRNQTAIDIVPKGCSKGNALLHILELEGIHKDKLFVVGDSYNDVSMFNVTKNSYTFNRAEEDVKKSANNCIDFVHQVINEINR